MRYRPTRRATSYAATILSEDQVFGSKLLDVSRDGARATIPCALLPGSAVRVRIAESDIPAIVHWCGKGLTGLRFLDRLDAATLRRIESARDEFDGYR